MRNLLRTLSVLTLVLSGTALLGPVACGGKTAKVPVMESLDAGPEPVDAEPPAPKTLYERVGGAEKLSAVVDGTLKGAAAHPKLKKSFAKITGPKLETLKKDLNDFLCEQMKGTCKYEGKDMRILTEAQWEPFVEVFVKALSDAGVGEAERDEALTLLTPLHDEMLPKKK